ncbi:MAG: hypothetical protein LBH53_03245, partial [Puniceicoccales bacterium]|nr:hypothetical protein [Puniceicoccales bacterium]
AKEEKKKLAAAKKRLRSDVPIRKKRSAAVQAALTANNANLLQNFYVTPITNEAVRCFKATQPEGKAFEKLSNAIRPFLYLFKDGTTASIDGRVRSPNNFTFYAVVLSAHRLVFCYLNKLLKEMREYDFNWKLESVRNVRANLTENFHSNTINYVTYDSLTVGDVQALATIGCTSIFTLNGNIQNDACVKNVKNSEGKFVTKEQFDALLGAIRDLREEVFRIVFEADNICTYNGKKITILELVIRAAADFDRKTLEPDAEAVDAAQKKLEFLRLSWQPEPTVAAENAEKLLVRRTRGIFERLNSPLELSDGTKTQDPVRFTLDRLDRKIRAEAAKSTFVGPVYIDPNASDVATALNDTLGLSGNDALLCLPCIQRNHKKEVSAFVAEFNRYATLRSAQISLQSAAETVIYDSTSRTDGSELAPLELFQKNEQDPSKGDGLVARLNVLKLPEEVARSSEAPIQGWTEQYIADLFRHMRSGSRSLNCFYREETFPEWKKDLAIEELMALLGANYTASDGKALVSRKSYELLRKNHEEKMAYQRRLAGFLHSCKIVVPVAGTDATVKLPLQKAYLRMAGGPAADDSDRFKKFKEDLKKATEAYAAKEA